MADNVYQPGDLVPLEATFRNAAGTPTNTTVTLTVTNPAGVVTTPTPTNPSPGVYHYDQAVAVEGLWWYTFAGTGAVTAVERDSFIVETLVPAVSARALVSLLELREFVLNDRTDDTQDQRLVDRGDAYSEMVYGYTRREWLPVTLAATRRFRYDGNGPLHLSPYDLRSATAVVTFTDMPTGYQSTLAAGTTTAEGDYWLRPYGGDPDTGTYRWLELDPYAYRYELTNRARRWLEVSITGDWGIGTVPEDVKTAVKIAVSDSVHNPEGAASRSFGALTVNEEPVGVDESARWRALPGESRALLQRYIDDPALVA